VTLEELGTPEEATKAGKHVPLTAPCEGGMSPSSASRAKLTGQAKTDF
jgi:hypothetical protein